MANPAPTLNQINAFNATQGTIVDFNIIGGTELVRSNRIYIYDLSDNSLICTHLYVSTESIHELPPNTDSSIVYESGKSSADFVNGAQYYAQIQTYTDTAGTEGGSGLSVAKMFWCLVDPTLTITTIPSTISTTSYNVSATYNANTSVVSNIIQQYQFSLYSATGSLLQSSGVVVGSGTQQGTSTAYDISYNFTGLSVGSSYYVVVDVTTTQGMSVNAQSNTFTVSIDTPTLGEATVVNNACDGYISVTSNLSGEYGGSASGEIATFETDSVNDVSSLKVTLTPKQDATPWIGTTHDTAPYLNRAMPTQSNDYNRESGVIVGGTVGWNQLVNHGNFDASTGWFVPSGGYVRLSISDNVATLTGLLSPTQEYSYALIRTLSPIPQGHKALFTVEAKLPKTGTFKIDTNGAFSGITKTWQAVANVWTTYSFIGNGRGLGTDWYVFPLCRTDGYGVGDSWQARNVVLFDLTQMFGTTIADYIYSLEQANAGAGVAWFRKYFPEEYYPYSANTLQSVQATAHKTYDGDGNVLGNYSLDSSLTLRGIPKLDASNNLYYDGDTYEADGTVERRYGIVDLGTLSWTKSSIEGNAFYSESITNALPVGNVTTANVLCAKYDLYMSGNGSAMLDKTFRFGGTYAGMKRVTVRDDSYTDATAFKTAMSGVYLVYELATPTTETADPYTNPQIVDPDGTEEYVTANYVPVGHDSTYSLVCPISGYDEVSANVVGKNLFDPLQSEQGYIDDADGELKGTAFPSSRSTGWIPVVSGETYFITSPQPSGQWGAWYDENKNYISGFTNYSVAKVAPNNASYIRATVNSGGVNPDYATNVMVCKGSTATAYEPYQGQTYTADLPQTVYGGTVDLVSGELVIDRAMVDLGTFDYTKGNITNRFITPIPQAKRFANLYTRPDVAKLNCSIYETVGGEAGYSGTNDYGISGSYWNGTNYLQINDLAKYQTMDATQFKAAMSGVQLVYELATPQTIQLTPQEIRTLLGTNNVWSDAGDVEITYNIPITNLLVKRQDVADVSGTWLTLYSRPITQASDMDFTFIDFLNQYGKTYKYALVPLLTQTQSGVEVEVEGGYTVSDEVQSIFDGVFIADATELQKCKANVGYGDVDMNQAVGTITPIGAKYPVVITNSKNQYHNGSITGTIVPDDYYFNGNLSRIDMVNKRNELEQFLTNKRAKIIKDWNSNIWLVMIMDNVTCTFNNEYGMGIVNFNANWIEVGDPTNQQDLQAAGLIDVGGV